MRVIKVCLNICFSSFGTALIDTIVPDTITTWVATAFALNEESGLGVAPSPANVINV